jgi:N-acetyl-anhydromuramyl-L-alanine amidase AmpD
MTPSGWFPTAVQKRIPPGASDPHIVPALAILHVAVTDIPSLFDFFLRRSGGIESHFYIRKDGTVEQYRSCHREADANLGANHYTVDGVVYGAVSIETAGFALGWWNKAQKAAILELLLWLHEEHDIPLKPVFVPHPSLAQGGVSWHSKFREWSPVAKSCPGPNRIIQYKRWLKPWMAEQSAPCLHCPKHCPSSEGDA